MPSSEHTPGAQPLDQAEALLHAGRPREVIDFLLDLPARTVLVPRAQNLLALAYLRSGDTISALRAIDLARLFGASEISLMKLNCTVYRALKDWRRLDETLELIVARAPAEAQIRYQLAIRLLATQKLPRAKHHAMILLQSGARSDLAEELRYRIAMTEDDTEAALDAVKTIVAQGEIWPDLPNLVGLFVQLPASERANLARDILAKWPEQLPNLGTYLEAGGLQPKVMPPEQQALILALAGQRQPALELLDEMKGNGNPDWSEIHQIVQSLPDANQYQRPLIEDDGSNVIISHTGNSRVTLLVFTGLADRAGMPIQVLDSFCAALGHSAVYLRDSTRTLFTSGAPELGANQEETLTALSGILNKQGTQHLLCFGSSAGGFAAVRYGIKLGAAHILCASGATNISTDFMTAVGDSRGKLVVTRLNKLVPAEDRDLSQDILSAGGECRIDMWYGANSPKDVAHAEFIRDLPGVTCFPIPDLDRHNTSLPIVAGRIFQEFLGISSVA
ncbi:hypothetical protein JCM7686_1674 [Paracoccus aminophilus JCM 7686]|uniref:Uncharacterized protein n=2 Tax=Paracoccus aminophilus TaxID=34003 RepID=S5XZ91_PARAH|nr:hypothetical protein JCM7686_1674 [Paracoccus aminophilus JCM 7686]